MLYTIILRFYILQSDPMKRKYLILIDTVLYSEFDIIVYE